MIEKPQKTFSIKDLVNGNNTFPDNPDQIVQPPVTGNQKITKSEFGVETLAEAWHDFTETIKGDGPRVISMFKSIHAEVENENTIKIHLSNANQKDLFVQNYKQQLLNFLINRFTKSDIDIETTVDLSETNNLLYSDDQKYNYLVTKYPALKDMKKTFNLDIN